MSDIVSQGDLIDIYYILPQEHKCIRDIGIVESTNSIDYVSLLGPEILKSLVVKGIIYVAEKLVKIIPAVKAYIIKGSWPIFFSKLLNYDEKVRNHLDKIALSTQIGPTPPSTEIYKYATEQL